MKQYNTAAAGMAWNFLSSFRRDLVDWMQVFYPWLREFETEPEGFSMSITAWQDDPKWAHNILDLYRILKIGETYYIEILTRIVASNLFPNQSATELSTQQWDALVPTVLQKIKDHLPTTGKLLRRDTDAVGTVAKKAFETFNSCYLTFAFLMGGVRPRTMKQADDLLRNYRPGRIGVVAVQLLTENDMLKEQIRLQNEELKDIQMLRQCAAYRHILEDLAPGRDRAESWRDKWGAEVDAAASRKSGPVYDIIRKYQPSGNRNLDFVKKTGGCLYGSLSAEIHDYVPKTQRGYQLKGWSKMHYDILACTKKLYDKKISDSKQGVQTVAIRPQTNS
jgi:hypothetical protein